MTVLVWGGGMGITFVVQIAQHVIENEIVMEGLKSRP